MKPKNVYTCYIITLNRTFRSKKHPGWDSTEEWVSYAKEEAVGYPEDAYVLNKHDRFKKYFDFMSQATKFIDDNKGTWKLEGEYTINIEKVTLYNYISTMISKTE